MLAQGTDLHVVSEILGHSSIAITKDVYGHLVEGQKRAAAARMSDAVDAQWLPQWFPEPARTGRGRWLRQKEDFDNGKYGRTRRDSNPPNLLIRRPGQGVCRRSPPYVSRVDCRRRSGWNRSRTNGLLSTLL